MKYVILITTAVLIFLGATMGFAAESTYTVPGHLKPMSTWRNVCYLFTVVIDS